VKTLFAVKKIDKRKPIVTSLAVAQYLIVASLGFLPYSILSTGFDRFTSKLISIELISLLIVGIVAIAQIGRVDFTKTFLTFLLFLISFALINILILTFEEARPQPYSIFIGITFAYIAGGILSNKHIEYTRAIRWWPIIAGLALLIISIYLLLTRNVDYPQQGFLKPVFSGGLVSTELSNISAIILISLCFIRANNITKPGYNFLILSIALLCLWFFSAGTILALFLIYLIHALRRSEFSGIYFKLPMGLIILSLALYLLVEQEVVDTLWLLRYTDDSVFLRFNIYENLYQAAKHNPLSGIGIGNFYMPPHHNFLGLAAETGFLSAGIYLVFSVGALIWTSRSTARLIHDGRLDVSLHWMLWSIALFLFIKGFVHDTWQDKIFYFCLGYIANKKWRKFS